VANRQSNCSMFDLHLVWIVGVQRCCSICCHAAQLSWGVGNGPHAFIWHQGYIVPHSAHVGSAGADCEVATVTFKSELPLAPMHPTATIRQINVPRRRHFGLVAGCRVAEDDKERPRVPWWLKGASVLVFRGRADCGC
jgi:hypothetical protein